MGADVCAVAGAVVGVEVQTGVGAKVGGVVGVGGGVEVGAEGDAGVGAGVGAEVGAAGGPRVTGVAVVKRGTWETGEVGAVRGPGTVGGFMVVGGARRSRLSACRIWYLISSSRCSLLLVALLESTGANKKPDVSSARNAFRCELAFNSAIIDCPDVVKRISYANCLLMV